MQLFHCYEVVASRPSPLEKLCQEASWGAFEQLTDGKTFFSEGYGATPPTGRDVFPWLGLAVDHMYIFSQPRSIPLRFGFTQRKSTVLVYLTYYRSSRST